MEDTKKSADAKDKDALWPFILIYAFMWTGMIGPSFNNDPIKGFTFTSILGLLCALAIVASWLPHVCAAGAFSPSPIPRFSPILAGTCFC